MSTVVWTAGLLERDCDTVGEPRILSWLSISPDGQLTRRSTGNGQGYLLGYNVWAQWELIRAVRGVIYPPNKDWQQLRLRTQMFNTGAPGVVVASYPHPRNDQPFNRVAAAMVTAVMPSVSSWWPLRGEVAWVGPLSTPDGLHASLSGQHLTTLEDLAEVVGRGSAR